MILCDKVDRKKLASLCILIILFLIIGCILVAVFFVKVINCGGSGLVRDTGVMAEPQSEKQSWTLCISGDVDQVFIVSVSKVRIVSPGIGSSTASGNFDYYCTYLLCSGEHSS